MPRRMPIVAPKTARPTTTVSRPLSTIAASAVVTTPATLDSSNPMMAELEISDAPDWPNSSPAAGDMTPVAANGPIWINSATT